MQKGQNRNLQFTSILLKGFEHVNCFALSTRVSYVKRFQVAEPPIEPNLKTELKK